MEQENHLLTEVLCGFGFDPDANTWDSTFYGKYFEYLQSIGYTEKTEQKGFQIKFEVKQNKLSTSTGNEDDESSTRMIFKNPTDQTAVVMLPHYIAFHKLSPYKNWENLLETQIRPGLAKYFELGLGKNLKQVIMTYLNSYEIPKNEKISRYFNFIPLIENIEIGAEKSLLFQTQYELENNSIFNLKLQSGSQNNSIQAFLECSCIANSNQENPEWASLADFVHSKNNVFFNLITKKIDNEKSK